MLELHQVTKCYGDKRAVNALSLQIEAGELFAFLGPNGAGKTTTIKMITGLLRPTEGQIVIGGHDVVAAPLAAKALVSYVPDVPYIYEKLTGREFLRFVARMYRMPPERYEPAMAALIERFQLGAFVDDLSERFSHGMRQRTVFAASLLPDPRLLVIDEPMVGLDPKSIRIVKDVLRERSAAGTTIFMSTHTLAIAEELADRIGIVFGGSLIALGTYAELKERSGHDGTLEEVFLKLTEEAEEKEGDERDRW